MKDFSKELEEEEMLTRHLLDTSIVISQRFIMKTGPENIN